MCVWMGMWVGGWEKVGWGGVSGGAHERLGIEHVVRIQTDLQAALCRRLREFSASIGRLELLAQVSRARSKSLGVAVGLWGVTCGV